MGIYFSAHFCYNIQKKEGSDKVATGIFKKGSIEMLALLMLQEGDIYGYQLIQLLCERSGGKLTVQEGSLYPLLYRMADFGFISCRDVTVETPNGRRRNRVLYHLEPSGRARLMELKAEFDQVQEGIQAVFRNSVPIGFEREEAHEPGGVAVSSGSEEENSLSSFPQNEIPFPTGG